MSRVFATLVVLCLVACGYVQVVGVSPEDEAQVFTGSGRIIVSGSAIDDDGNHYLVGVVDGVISLGALELRSRGDQTAYLVSFTADGDPRWSQTWSGSASYATSVDVRGESVNVIGYLSDLVNGPIEVTTSGRQDLFVFSFDRSDGAAMASPRLFASDGGNLQGKALDASSTHSLLAGHYVGTVDFGLGPLQTTPPGIDHGFVALFNASGESLWSQSVAGAHVLLNAALLEADGSAVAAGFFERGSIGGRNAEGEDALVVGYASDGAIRYELAFGSGGNDRVRAVAAFEDGVIIVGASEGEFTLGSEPLVGRGARDGFIARLDADGNVLWAQTIDGTSTEALNRVRVGGGRVYAAGRFDAEVRFGEETLRSAGGMDVMVLVFDAEGNALAASQLGGVGDESVGGLEVQSGVAWVALALAGETVLDASGPQDGVLGLRSLQF